MFNLNVQIKMITVSVTSEHISRISTLPSHTEKRIILLHLRGFVGLLAIPETKARRYL